MNKRVGRLKVLLGPLLALAVATGCTTVVKGSAAPLSEVAVILDPSSGTVSVGKPDTKSAVDVYEDFLCPYCKQFEQQDGDQLSAQVNQGAVKVTYHLVNLLDQASKPAGYSSLAANAALTVAQLAPTKFLDFHKLLFDKQPKEDTAGYTDDQLIAFAQQAGVNDPELAAAIKAHTYTDKVSANLQAAIKDPKVQTQFRDGSKGFGTPVVLVDGKMANWLDPKWLTTS